VMIQCREITYTPIHRGKHTHRHLNKELDTFSKVVSV
jgi:hypothetical protein